MVLVQITENFPSTKLTCNTVLIKPSCYTVTRACNIGTETEEEEEEARPVQVIM